MESFDIKALVGDFTKRSICENDIRRLRCHFHEIIPVLRILEKEARSKLGSIANSNLLKILAYFVSNPTVERFSEEIFVDDDSLLNLIFTSLEVKSKRKKLSSLIEEKELLTSIAFLFNQLPKHVFHKFRLKIFLKLIETNKDEEFKWLCLLCVTFMLELTEEEHVEFVMKYGISESSHSILSFKYQSKFNNILSLGSQLNIKNVDENVKSGSIAERHLASNEIGGFVRLESSMKILDELSLLLSSRTRRICISGEVGVGKSTILKTLGNLHHRNGYPLITFVQMSEGMDSRLLLGSYHSTDLPGQFVWKPGPLTSAILNGNWIVLEDFDSAPPDVTILAEQMVDSGNLVIPGFGEISHVNPNFKLFATWRKGMKKLGSNWSQVQMKEFEISEIKKLLEGLFPYLKPLIEKLTHIFTFLLDESEIGRNRRKPSIRDLIKLCRRIPQIMDLNDPTSAIFIFQDVFDIFGASVPLPGDKLTIAEGIGKHLNILRTKCEFFCTAYSPHINVCSSSNVFTAGRQSLDLMNSSSPFKVERSLYSLTKRASCLLERVAVSVGNHEPLLLIGETGVGKTSCIQYLANILNKKLVVVNLNRQSDAADLLGGYKPVELKYIFAPLREEFELLFGLSFNVEENRKFLNHIMSCFANRRWVDLTKLMFHVQKKGLQKTTGLHDQNIYKRWAELGKQLGRVEIQLNSDEPSPFAFSFIEGSLIDAIKKGHWILLDEINLASIEMLQCLSSVLDESEEIHLWEKADGEGIKKNLNFHLFAAMNPSTDVGKKNLPLGIRNRFTEIYVDELRDPDELRVLVSDYLSDLSLFGTQLDSIVTFYLKILNMAETALVDETGKRPHFSLRTLCRALKISSYNLYGSVNRSLYESFCLSFLTQLDRESHSKVHLLIAKSIFGKTELKAILNQKLPKPTVGDYIQMEGYWIPQGDDQPFIDSNYILTESVKRNLKDLCRIVSAGKLPVLIQGETSVGKTSLISYLAKATGNICFRINNHQHTDLQEYIGTYQSDSNGKLVFIEGVLVQAMRQGHWIILDELNLAPSEVLEALNRLLDDNRELFVSETGEHVRAHPRFTLFATQNPPGMYGGRKNLSRAFRNRFIELHFDEIPSNELEEILHLRSKIPKSYCKKIIGVLKELQLRRKTSAALQGKHGFATLRDLFRWAERYRLSEPQTTTFYDWDQHLADEGFLVLAGKIRNLPEETVIQETLFNHFKRTPIPQHLFSLHASTSSVTRGILEEMIKATMDKFPHVVWTFEMRRLAVLLACTIKFKEPALLVGETGTGKTTIVQVLSELYGNELLSVSCHQQSEGSDFLGGLRPMRGENKNGKLFEWVDGPLVKAMETGGIFLTDEISLADDSVLERINSVLEPERTLLLAEQGESNVRVVKAHEKFHFVATMNPGGDYGKKELSPALRNRLTEIWARTTNDDSDIILIIEHNLRQGLKNRSVGNVMVEFVRWLKCSELSSRLTISIRDFLGWAEFLNSLEGISLTSAVVHGASLVFLDGLGTGTTAGAANTDGLYAFKNEAKAILSNLCSQFISSTEEMETVEKFNLELNVEEKTISLGPFKIPSNSMKNEGVNFAFEAPTTSLNTLRVFRAMQLKKAILLEGSPGVGKTGLITALSAFASVPLVRINLSEQTDISDLFGADLPIEGASGGNFSWRDGPLLTALKNNSWILLDELNLASQTVLEGLNACLDHRGEIFVPELNRTFYIQRGENSSRIFACQNPFRQGGARKGLPKSFLNRFTQVYMEPLERDDLFFILSAMAPTLGEEAIRVMGSFSEQLERRVNTGEMGGKGSPWDFNLRDLTRWAEVLMEEMTRNDEGDLDPGLFIDLIYGIRMRTDEDREKVMRVFHEIRPLKGGRRRESRLGVNEPIVSRREVRCGRGRLERLKTKDLETFNAPHPFLFLHKQSGALEALVKSLQMGWMPILVGKSGGGKRSLVRLLAQMCGKVLRVLSPTPEMDAMELLGGFEQADIYRRVDGTSSKVGRALLGALKEQLTTKELNEQNQAIVMRLLTVYSTFKCFRPLTAVIGKEEKLIEEFDRIKERLVILSSMVDFLTNIQSSSDFSECWEELASLNEEIKVGIRTGAFTWIDSALISAMEAGDWLLIDGANRCSSAVLDRLNSVVEPGGKLILSERGSVGGELKEVIPHPNFRLILALDPAQGEISRAMRNRGLEIYVPSHPSPNLITEPISEENGIRSLEDESYFDMDALLLSRGLTDSSLRSEAMRIHNRLMNPEGTSPNKYHGALLSSLGESIVGRLEAGFGVKETLDSAFLSTHFIPSRDVLTDANTVYNNEENNSNRHPLIIGKYLNSQTFRVFKQLNVLDSLIRPTAPLLQNIRLNLKDHDLFDSFVLVSLFSRMFPQDARSLIEGIKTSFPLQSSLASRLEDALKRNLIGESNDGPWDPRWNSGGWTKDKWNLMRISLLLHSNVQISHEVNEASLLHSTLGFYSKNYKLIDEGQKREFLPLFFNLLIRFDECFHSILSFKHDGAGGETSWIEGMKVFLWRKRLFELSQMKVEGNKLSEMVISNVTLLVNWMAEYVVPFFNKYGDGNEMRDLIHNCLTPLIDDTDKKLVAKNQIYRSTLPIYSFPKMNDENLESAIFQLMTFFRSVWSLKPLLSCEAIVKFLGSERGIEIHEFLSRAFPLTLQAQASCIDEATLNSLSSIMAQLEKQTRLELENESCSFDQEYHSSCLALQFFANDLKSFESPINFSPFFDWENKERMRILFNLHSSSPSYFHITNHIPVLIKRVIIQGSKFRIPSLESRPVHTERVKTVNFLLGKELMKEVESSGDILKHIVSEVLEEIEHLSPSFPEDAAEYKKFRGSLTTGNEMIEKGKVLCGMSRIGELLCEFASYLTGLTFTLPLVDPAVEKEILGQYLAYEENYFSEWVDCQRGVEVYLKGIDFPSSDHQWFHPYISAGWEEMGRIREKLSIVKLGLPHRPHPPSYEEIRVSIRRFYFSLVHEKLSGLVEILRDLYEKNTFEEEILSSALTAARQWIQTGMNFIKNISDKFWYWDIILPFIRPVTFGCRGLELMCSALKYKFESKQTFERLIQFPIQFNTMENFGENFAGVSGKELFMISLRMFMNEVEILGGLSPPLLKKFNNFCLRVCFLFREQEEANKAAKAFEDALFVFKGKERNLSLTEEEMEANELNQLFPQFNDFDEFNNDHLNDEKMDIEEVMEKNNDILTDEDVEFFLNCYKQVLTHVKSEWINEKQTPFSLDFISPILKRFELGCGIFDKIELRKEEVEFLPSACIATHYMMKEDKTTSSTYDFYHDSNVNEVMKLTPIFDAFSLRVKELLKEWPEHPSLNKVIEVIERIKTFKMDSPLVKFVTGLECLLATSQEWEVCAHKGVSIASHLKNITDLILFWRKEELHCWKILLDITLKKERVKGNKWFFYLFSAVNEAYESTKPISQLLPALVQFMERCSLGEFHFRLEIIYNVQKHLLTMRDQANKNLSQLVAYMWNVYVYYKQFSSIVLKRLEDLRGPIEKKMKDFVKICRWNDGNYFALKDSVKKCQSTLGKLVKEFKVGLNVPVSTFIVADLNAQLGEGIKEKKKKRRECKIENYFVQESLKGFENIRRVKRLNKLNKYLSKMKDITDKLHEVDEIKFLERISQREELSINIIQSAEELQSLEVTEECHEKRKKAYHNIHSRKRAALADLFKELSKYISYRRGLIKLKKVKEERGNLFYDFTPFPIDIKAGWKEMKLAIDKELMTSWEDCESYFVKSIARLSTMLTSFDTPSKELGINILDRSKGFAFDLFILMETGIKGISLFSSHLWNLRHLIESSEFIGSSKLSTLAEEHIYEKICSIEFDTRQFVILLNSISTQPENLELIINLQKALTIISKIKTSISTLSQRDVLRGKMSREMNMEEFASFDSQFVQVITIYEDCEKLSCKSSLGLKLAHTITLLKEFHSNLPEKESEREISSDEFYTTCDSLVENILLSVQNLRTSRTRTEKEGEIASIKEIQKFFSSLSTELEKINFVFSYLLKFAEGDQKRINVLKDMVILIKQYGNTCQYYLVRFLKEHRSNCKLLSILTRIFTTLSQKGFCLPPDYDHEQQEVEGESEDKSGMGLGDGEMAPDVKDMSDKLESEDQLEEALRPGETPQTGDKDLDDEDKGIEMSDDFEGKMQDKEDKEPDNSDEEEEKEKEEEELDKQMGDVDDSKNDLDEQLWGGSSDEEDEDAKEEEEDSGKKGAEVKEENKLEAKEDLDESKEKKGEKERKGKDLEEENNEEINDDQIDPFHGDMKPDEEEMEDLDLPDNIQLDEGEAKDKEEIEENPFDLDEEKNEFPEEPEKEVPEEEGKDEKDSREIDKDDGEEEEGKTTMDFEPPTQTETNEDLPDDEAKEEEKLEEQLEQMGIENQEEENAKEEVPEAKCLEENPKESGEKVEPSEEEKGPDETTTPNETGKGKNEENNALEKNQEENAGEEEVGAGQAESEGGTKGKSSKDQIQEEEKSEENKPAKKPGESELKRTLANQPDQSHAKRLKTRETLEEKEDEGNERETLDSNAELFEHVKEASSADPVTLDNASREEVERQEREKKLEEKGKEISPEEIEEVEEDMETETPDLLRSLPKKENKKQRKEKEKEKNENEAEMMDVEGQTALTFGAQRPSTSFHHTRTDLLDEWRDQRLEKGKEEEDGVEDPHRRIASASVSAWVELEGRTLGLAQELCEQLRLILEPTLAARLKGDYKTGKRLNMRKVIPYIASGFRKDKIWLRRTELSKREYQILIALDDSASMADNQSKQMAFSSLAVLARSLNLLEAGKLGVLSFGEEVELLHPFDEPFSELTGASLVEKFTFAQRRTRIAQLMSKTISLFRKGRESTRCEVAQLLLIVSDGRGVCNEGSNTVKAAVQRAREENIFTVFVIVDNPENKDSIIDIRLPVFGPNNELIEISKYLDHFPFPFYLILRDLAALPNVLSDALRQWFELVTSDQR